MPIKPIDTEDDIEEYEETRRTSSMAKSVLLGAIIIMGMLFGFFYSQNEKEIKKQAYRAGVRPSSAPTQAPFKPVAAYNDDVESTLDDIRNESSKAVGDGVATVVGAGSDVLGAATKSVTSNVTKKVQDTASNSAQMVTDTLYKSTVGKVIIQLFSQLPPGAKTEVVEELMKQVTPSPSPTPDP